MPSAVTPSGACSPAVPDVVEGLRKDFGNVRAVDAEEVWRAYATPIAGTIERARHLERLLAALDPADLESVSGPLRALAAPTLLVWGTGDAMFGLKWAYQLRDIIPGAREVIEVEGAKTLFPEERPGALIPQLRRHWGR